MKRGGGKDAVHPGCWFSSGDAPWPCPSREGGGWRGPVRGWKSSLRLGLGTLMLSGRLCHVSPAATNRCGKFIWYTACSLSVIASWVISYIPSLFPDEIATVLKYITASRGRAGARRLQQRLGDSGLQRCLWGLLALITLPGDLLLANFEIFSVKELGHRSGDVLC